MGSSQSEIGECAMIKMRSGPTRRTVTHGTIRRKSNLDVIGVLRGIEIFRVTADAIGAGSLVVTIGMANRAVQGGVHAGQGEARKCCVVKGCSKPAIHPVALEAVDRKRRRGVTGEAGLNEGLPVASHAIRG